GDRELGSTPAMNAPKKRTLPVGYGPPTFSARSAHAGFAGTDFSLQPDGTVLCPAKHSLTLLEQRPLKNGSIRLVYAAHIHDCRGCPLRSACQGPDNSPRRARRVHAVCQPLPAHVVLVEASSVPIESTSTPVEAVPVEMEPMPSPAGVNVP